MSHFTKLRTRIKDVDLLCEALTKLGYKFTRGPARVMGWQGRATRADVAVHLPNGEFDIGFVKKHGSYEIVADWWGIKSETPESFGQKVNQQYACCTVVSELAAEGFRIEEQEVDKSQAIRLRLVRVI